MSRRTLVLGSLCTLLGFVAGALAATGKQMVVVPFAKAQFSPVNRARPEGSALATLWGDPDRGPSATLQKMRKDVLGRFHVHTSDYHLVVVEGTMMHRPEGKQEAEVEPLGPGSYWFQPGGQVHADRCLADECVLFVYWSGKRDAFLHESEKRVPGRDP